VAADRQELMVLQRYLRPSIARANGQLNPWCTYHTTAPTSHTRPSPRKHSADGAIATEEADI